MGDLFMLSGSAERDPRVEAWFQADDALRLMVRPWFDELRRQGPDVRELLHDGCPTACVDDAALAYVNAFSGHASIGFFNGAGLADPAGLLEGAGKRMRHVKLRWGAPVDEAALRGLIAAAYRDIRSPKPLEAEPCTSADW